MKSQYCMWVIQRSSKQNSKWLSSKHSIQLFSRHIVSPPCVTVRTPGSMQTWLTWTIQLQILEVTWSKWVNLLQEKWGKPEEICLIPNPVIQTTLSIGTSYFAPRHVKPTRSTLCIIAEWMSSTTHLSCIWRIIGSNLLLSCLEFLL